MKPDASQYNPDPQYIADLVNSTGLSQPDLGKVLGVTDRTIRNWMSGRVTIDYMTQFALESLVLSV